MNPWLENPALWRGVHQRLITAISDELAPRLEPRCFVDVEAHTYIAQTPATPLQTRYPDLSLVNVGGPGVVVATQAEATQPTIVALPEMESFEEPYLQIRSMPDGEVVTVIEVLSHTNKRPGSERESYIRKREQFFLIDVHFVGIDLLRLWPPLPFTEQGRDEDYRIFLHRKDEADRAYLYPFSVRQPIPIFPIPLLPDDQEPLLDLSPLLQAVYDRARYHLIIDYHQPPTPPLRETDAAWAAERFVSAHAA
jgi:hypothetical protein